MTLIVALLVFVPMGIAVWFGLFYALCRFLDWECEKCLREQPDNPFCCE